MRRSILFALVVQLSCVASVFGWDDPVAGRKPLRYWVDRLNDSDAEVREQAVKFVRIEVSEFSDLVWEGEPLDLKGLKRRGNFRQEATPLIPELLKALRNTDENVVGVAAEMLMLLGPEAQVALPDLERIILSESSTASTRTTMFYVLLFATPEDKPVGPILLKLLNSLPWETYENLLNLVYGSLPSDDDQQSENAQKQRGTMVALSIPAYLGPMISSGHTKIEVPYLVKIATGEYPTTIRAMAIGILGGLEFDAKSAVPALRKLLKDEDRLVRSWAVNALSDIEPDPQLVPELIEALGLKGEKRDEAEQGMREWLKQQEQERESLRELYKDGDDLTDFVQAIKHGSGYQRRQAIQHLGQIGPGAKSIIPELRKALQDPDEDTRRMAAEAIKQIETTAPTSNND
ncbi:HEAT repeat protein [Symmachiella dynata]|uniref:HEAT repeat protein n=1 Tax=Symmachiella dynata TaxID=2527995 RepID=A0A517ZMJ9_9PLAN|nr:HEAT repeat domain-containing protein [Symmachiella dynata]QDU43713.1 HEAT repeat protein [Symmachiella dynata]